MTIMLYPGKEDPKGYRVQDKVLQVNNYYPISIHGSLDKARLAATQEQERLNTRRRMRKLRMELPINKVFYENGKVIGMRTGKRIVKGEVINLLIAQITVDKKQITNSRQILGNFKTQYLSLCTWILEKRGLQMDRTLREAFERTAYRYGGDFNFKFLKSDLQCKL